jgi:hypothetical protein
MKPDADHLLRMLAGRLLMHVTPEVATEYTRSNVGLISLLMMAAAEDFDRAAARLIEENGQMRRIFSDAAAVVSDSDLRQRLEEAAVKTDEDFRVSALESANQPMRALLIDLHAHIEGLEGQDAKRIDNAIWTELAASAKRRSFMVWPM